MDGRGRLRQARLTAGAAPWRRAPRLLLRHPGVFAAAVLASGVLALAAASGSLFVSSVGTAALHDEAGQECPESALPAVGVADGNSAYLPSGQPPARLPGQDASVRAALTRQHVPSPYLVTLASVTGPGGPGDRLVLFSRAGALDHVRALTPKGPAGVWVPRSYAATAHLRAGSTIPLSGHPVPVAGVYRDIAPSAFDPSFHLPRYWCTWSADLVPSLEYRPPPVLLADPATVRTVASYVGAVWYVRQDTAHTTIPQLRTAIAGTAGATARLPGFHTLNSAALLVNLAARERDGTAGSIVPIDVAGVVVAALLVCLAGVFWSVRRVRELRLLNSRGVSRAAVGVKAALESGPAVILGAAGGLALSFGLVAWEGPSAILEPGGRTRARRQHLDLSYDINPTTFLQGTRLRPITWILGYLRAMAYLVGLVALSGLIFIFTSRTRRTALSYHLACRMGLTRRRHRRALLAELTLVLGTSWALGVGVAMLGVLVVYRLADPYPDSPPPPQLPVPLSAVGVAGACCAVLAVAGAISLQALLDRLRPTDLLRAA